MQGVKPETIIVATAAFGLLASLILYALGYGAASRIVYVAAAVVAFLPLFASLAYLVVEAIRKSCQRGP